MLKYLATSAQQNDCHNPSHSKLIERD